MSINPALADLGPLVGRWRMELYNAAFLLDPDGRATGSIEIDWIEEGSALRMRQGNSENPSAAVAAGSGGVEMLVARQERDPVCVVSDGIAWAVGRRSCAAVCSTCSGFSGR